MSRNEILNALRMMKKGKAGIVSEMLMVDDDCTGCDKKSGPLQCLAYNLSSV